MKKIIISLIGILLYIVSANAQTKTAYCDLYVRGGGQNLRTSIMYNHKPIHIGRANTAEMLNKLSELGWEIQNDISGSIINVKRAPALCTRHKFHLILKKTYAENENPFHGLDQMKYNKPIKDVKKKDTKNKKNKKQK